MLVKKNADPDSQTLQLIDAGAEDIQDSDDGLEVYVAPDKLGQIHRKLVGDGFEVTETELQMKPINFQTITDHGIAARALKFMDEVESLEDVQKVFSNLDIPDEVVKNV